MLTLNVVKAGILARSNPRKQATVEGLLGVLETMGKKGVRVFSIATVARACQSAGVMSPSTITNASGADYRALIEAYAGSVGASTAHMVSKSVSPLDEAIASVKDLDVRTKLRAIIAENANYRREGERVKAAIKRMRPVEAPSGAMAPSTAFRHPSSAARIDLVPLQKFLAADWLADNHWTVDRLGAITTRDGDRVTPVGFVFALSKVLATLSTNDHPSDRAGSGEIE